MKLAKREKHESELARPLRGWSPFGELSRLHESLNRLFEYPFGWSTATTPLFEGWLPAADIYEDKDNVVVTAELPGMKKEDIHVSLSENMLTISGERKDESELKEEGGYQKERYFGRFQRSIALPVPVQGGKIHAEYKDGILKVTCPKSEEVKRKEIQVEVE